MRAKDLLDDLDVPYKAYEFRFDSKFRQHRLKDRRTIIILMAEILGEERMVENHEVRRRLIELTKQSTVPNIFVNGKHLGGSSDLIDAHESGKLQKMLETKNPNWVEPSTVKSIPTGWSDVDGKE